MHRQLFALALASGSWMGCSDDPAPMMEPPDASTPNAQCLVEADYGELGALTGSTGSTMSPTSLTVVLDAGPPRDSFFINLKNGIGTGTYQIDGADADATTCSLCVNIIADIVAMQGPTKFYFATAGSVMLTATQPPAGSLSNVTFVETTSGGAPTNSGCTSRIGSMTFGPS